MFERPTTPIFKALPEYFRQRDGEESRALEALMGVLTEELQIVERDIDQLYDNWFVETCEPWVLPYIAELIGATPMREIGEGAEGMLRAYVANVLQYRQAKGTSAALEQIAHDVSGWHVVVVEYFQQLATSQHVNHVRPERPVFADVRNSTRARLAHRPFSENLHAPAAGPVDGYSGRYNIPHLGLFIWNQGGQPLGPVYDASDGYLGGPEPAVVEPDRTLFRFDPLGRDLPLVNRPVPDNLVSQRVTARKVPERLRREPLAMELDELRAGKSNPEGWFFDNPVIRVRLDGNEVPATKLHCCNLDFAPDNSFRRPKNAGEVMFDPVLGRISLHTDDAEKRLETGFSHGRPFEIGGGPYDRRASMEEWWSQVFVPGEAPPWRIGVSKRPELQTENPDQGGIVVSSVRLAIERWNGEAVQGQRGIITILDNASYPTPLTGQRRLQMPRASKLVIIAADWPGTESDGGIFQRDPDTVSPLYRRGHISNTLQVDAEDAGEGTPANLVLDGLAIARLSLVNSGDLGELHINNCTIGGSDGRLRTGLNAPGHVRLNVSIKNSIAGRIRIPESNGTIAIADSLVGRSDQTPAHSREVVGAPKADIEIESSTVFGEINGRSIEAENSIFSGRITVARKQIGCVRFSYLPVNSAVPRRYRCVPNSETVDVYDVRPIFLSEDFKNSGFGQLNPCCPVEICEGAEGNFEMGVGFSLRVTARLANLHDAINEFSPFGLSAGFHFIN